MAELSAAGGRARHPVIARLHAEPAAFELVQAVALLEAADPAATLLGEGADAAREAVRLRGQTGSAFPPGDVAALRLRAGLPELEVNALSLAGAFGPLPPPLAELLRRRVAERDTAMRDFLDIFNHRLASLLVRALRAGRPALGLRGGAGEPPFARALRGVAGLATPGLAHRLGPVEDRAVLRQAGLLARRPPSQQGLEALLSDHLGLRIRLEPLQACRRAIEPEDLTRIGRAGRNSGLGRGAVLGRRVTDATAGLAAAPEPLDWPAYCGFLPGRPASRAVSELANLHAGPETVLGLRLTLKPGAIRTARLTARGGCGSGPDAAPRPGPPDFGDGARLGWTTWLGTRVRGERHVTVGASATGDGAAA